jgi:hypothetical protein
MRITYILVLTIFICTYAKAQTTFNEQIAPYDYATALKGGYKIAFKFDDNLQHLYLKKGSKTITELSSTSRGLPYKNLGYIGADFTNYFVLVQSFGSGNPSYIELIKKATGKNTLKKSAAWIGADNKKEFLLYCDNDVPDEKDKMILLNIRTGQKQYFSFPNDIFDQSGILNRIQISRLTDKQLVIEYDTEKSTKTKVYKR